MKRVAASGVRIRKACGLNFDLDEYEVAAWLHNTDRVKPYSVAIDELKAKGLSFREAFALTLESFFGSNPFNAEATARIIKAVVEHSKKDDDPGDSHLLMALRIAHKLDRLNPLGLMSAVAHQGPHLPLYDPYTPMGYETTVEGKMKSVYDNIFRVLEWVAMLPDNGARSLIVREDLRAYINFLRALGAQLARECGVRNTVEADIKKALGPYYRTYAFQSFWN